MTKINQQSATGNTKNGIYDYHHTCKHTQKE